MAVTNRGSILISTANDIGSSLVDVIGGEGYSPNEWAKEINICGIAAADIPTALDNIEESTPSGTDRGDISLDTANAVGAVLNKKFNTARGFKPSEWASAISKLTELEVKTASGAIASFNDGADDVPIESATFEFSPNQDLNGQDAPYPPGGGKNRFSADEIYAHGFWNQNGSFTNSENYYAYIIKADPETDYTYNAGFTGITTFLDSNGDYISGLNQGSGLASRTVTTPANTAYITASILITNLNGTQQIEKGSSATSYAPYANICPITGYEGLTIYQTGKNFIPLLMWYTAGYQYTNAGVTFEILSDGGIRITGKSTGTYSQFNLTAYSVSPQTEHQLQVPSGTFTFSLSGIVDGIRLVTSGSGNNGFPYSEVTYTSQAKSGAVTDGTKPFNYLLLRVYPTDNNLDVTVYPQLEIGSTATAYQVYKAKTPIVDSFGRTVYGGSRKADGTLTENILLKEFDHTSDWHFENASGGKNFYVSIGDNFKARQYIDTKGLFCNVCSPSTTAVSQRDKFYISNGKNFNWTCGDTLKLSSAQELKDYLQQNNLVVKVSAQIITPNEYTLEEIDMGNSFYGGNNVYSDTNGNTTVAYRADIDLSAT